jgi:hypothetical protein
MTRFAAEAKNFLGGRVGPQQSLVDQSRDRIAGGHRSAMAVGVGSRRRRPAAAGGRAGSVPQPPLHFVANLAHQLIEFERAHCATLRFHLFPRRLVRAADSGWRFNEQARTCDGRQSLQIYRPGPNGKLPFSRRNKESIFRVQVLQG